MLIIMLSQDSELWSSHVINVDSRRVWTPGGVLRYINDGDMRSPFLGLKFAI